MRTIALAGMVALLIGATGLKSPRAGDRIPPPRVRAWQMGLLRDDRLRHLSLAFTSGLGTGLVTRSSVAAAGTAFGLGLAKEIRDRPHTGFDAVDLIADSVGAALAAWATHAVR
jgi:hypothetical protein